MLAANGETGRACDQQTKVCITRVNGKNVLSAPNVRGVYFLGIGTVLGLARDAGSMVR